MEDSDRRIIRFSIPPVLFLAFLLLAAVLRFGSGQVKAFIDVLDPTRGILLSINATIALGFIISSIPVFLFRLPYKLMREISLISRSGSKKEFNENTENMIGRAVQMWEIHGKKREYIQKKIARQRDMNILTANSFWALALVFLVVHIFIFKLSINNFLHYLWWYIPIILCAGIFFYNAWGVREELRIIDKKLEEN